MGKTKISWCDEVYNPIWGCNNNCNYCYARKFAYRMSFNKKLMDHFKKYDKNLDITKLRKFEPTWIESNFIKSFPKKPKRIFVNSMSDIAFWKEHWMKNVLCKIEHNPQHTFLFLTKRLGVDVYRQFEFPQNCWLGLTITNANDMKYFDRLHCANDQNIKFISLEPILSNFNMFPVVAVKIALVNNKLSLYDFITDWLIMGLQTNGFVPHKDTIKTIVSDCKFLDVPIFMKDSMKKVWDKELIREFPK